MTGNPQITLGFGGPFDEVLPDEKYPKPTAEQLTAWRKRLKENGTKILYHQTSTQIAEKILNSNKMIRGTSGLAGGGIYFATTPEHTDHKALQKGSILECEVALGNIYQTESYGDSSLSFRKLLSMNPSYDSVLIPRKNGYEYVVYSWEQVKSVKMYESPEIKTSSWWFW